MARSGKATSSLLTPDEIIPRLRVSRSTLYEWLAKGELPSYRIGRIIRIRESDVTEFLERRRRVARALATRIK
jgi:excisionase family DNA binding protein